MGPYCKFCNQRCFVPIPASCPSEILKAYGTSSIVATCHAGQEFERERVGYSYRDMIASQTKPGTDATPDKAADCAAAWEALRLEILERIEKINAATPWKEIEPAWWLHMMDVARAARRVA